MNAVVFVDTNVIIYAYHGAEPEKQPRAMKWIDSLWRERLGRTSMQVLSECYATFTHKIKPALSSDAAWDIVETLFTWNPQPIDAATLGRAFEIQSRYRLSWWDSLVVAAAQLQSCTILLSEDLQEGANYGGVIIRNPFTLGIAEAAAEYSSIPTATHRYRGRGRPRRTTFAATG